MTTVSFTYEGPPVQRQVVKATAMAPLSALLADACAKMRPPLDPARASLLFNKKPLADLSCPFRLANIPAGSNLTLLYDKPAAGPSGSATAGSTAAPVVPTSSGATARPVAAAVGPTAAPTAVPVPGQAIAPFSSPSAAVSPPCSAPTEAVAALDAVPTTATSSGTAAPAAAVAAPDVQQRQHPETSAAVAGHGKPQAVSEPSVVAKPNPMEAEVEAEAGHPHVDSGGAATGRVTAAAGGSGGGGDDDNEHEDDPEADHLGLGRPSALFSREALEAALEKLAAAASMSAGGAGTSAAAAVGAAGGGGGGDDAEGDEFFEVTPEDLAVMLRSSQARRMQEEAGGFRTRAAREAEERAKASSYTHVAIRAHLPGEAILQATFAATDTVGALRAAVLSVLLPSLAPAAYLYITPPRQLLRPERDGDSLYHAGLMPAAHVHVGLDEQKAAAAGHVAGAAVLGPAAVARMRTRIGPGLAAFHGSRQAKHPGEERARQKGERQLGAAAYGGGGSAAQAAGEGRAPGGGAGGGAKVPKWLKLGAK